MTDLINKYRTSKRDKAIHNFCEKWFIPEDDFRTFANSYTSLANINEYGNFDKLMDTVDKTKLVERLSNERGKKIAPFVALRELRKTITNFVVSGCMEE